MVVGDFIWMVIVGVPVCCWWLYYGWAARRVAGLPELAMPGSLPAAAVIVAARNEAPNLRKFLPHLLEQQYPGEWSVWVVDDHSVDDTAQVVAALAQQARHLHYLPLADGKQGKKVALEAGIEACGANYIIITDADCYPASSQWLPQMVQPLAGGCVSVVGFSPCTKEGKGLLMAYQQYEYAAMGLLYLSAAAKGKPYMAVGRNMGFTKEAYEICGGMAALPHIMSGSDDLLLQRMAKQGKVGVVPTPTAWVYTVPQLHWRQWWRQKSRHVSAGRYYSAIGKWWLGGWMAGLVMYYVLLLTIGFQMGWWIVILVHLMRSAAQIGIFERWSRTGNRLMNYLWLPILDILLLIYVICGVPLMQWKAIQTWK